MKPLPTLQELALHVNYNPTTGLFHRTSPTRKTPAGAVVAHACSGGYIQLLVAKRLISAHRAAFLFMEGHWPPHEVDHKDGNRANNVFSNLRHATRAENNRNQCIRKDSTTGVKGVSLARGRGGIARWVARVQLAGVSTYLGSFPTLCAAEQAVRQARQSLHAEFASHA